MNKVIGSGGGKSGGSGGGISEDPDTLSSVAFARFVDLIGEGEIKGLVNGNDSIYLDGVPLSNIEGTQNYRPFLSKKTVGTQAQLPIPGFSGTVSETAVGLQIRLITGAIVRSVPDADADSVRVTIAVNGFSQTSASGKIGITSIDYKIGVRVVAGSWVNTGPYTLMGKTNSRFQRSHEINLKDLGPGPYEVRVERVTADSVSALLTNNLFWDSYAIINYEPFSYPNSALVAIEVDGRYFSTVPTRAYHVKGLIVRVPSNYNPVTRVYTGVWNGTFILAYTNNPAWCFYDLVTNRRYGLGKRVSENQISKWMIYEIGKYCDEMVPTGLVGNIFGATGQSSFSSNGSANVGVPVRNQVMEPRFTLNCVINTKEDAYKVLNNLSSVFRGMAYWANGAIWFTQDRPTTPSMIWTNANVVDGIFTYEGSARGDRHTTCTVAWNDPAEDFRQRFEYVEDRDGILRYGIRPMEMLAFGCTSQSQARRTGLWLLYTERIEKDAIKFRAGLDSANVMPGDVGKIMDNNRTGARWGGRVISATVSVVRLDAPVVLTAGAYTLSVMAIDGTVSEKAVNIGIAGTFSELTVAINFALAPSPMALWTLASTVVVPMLGRVIQVVPVNSHEVDIVCLEHNPTKYAAIELGAAFEQYSYSTLSFNEVAGVTNLSLVEDSYKLSIYAAIDINMDVSWDSMSDPMIRGFTVKVSGATGNIFTFPETKDSFQRVTGIVPDTYTVTVNAVNVLGIVGKSTVATLVVTGIDTNSPAAVTGLAYTIEFFGVGFYCDKNAEKDVVGYEWRVGSTWELSQVIQKLGGTSVTWPVQLSGAFTVWVSAVDGFGNLSTPVSLSGNIGTPAVSALSDSLIGETLVLQWTGMATSFAISGYQVKYGATFASGTPVDFRQTTSYVENVKWIGSRIFWVAALDVKGNVGTAVSTVVTINSPNVVTSARSEVIDNNALLYWSPSVVGAGQLPIDRYEVRKGASFAGGTVVGSNGNSTFAAIFEQSSGVYTYWVAAVDTAGNVGTAVGIAATINQPPDYVLRNDYNSALGGTKVNFYLAPEGLLGPTDITTTWDTHFSVPGWANIDAQVAAGNTLYSTPSVASGSYEEIIDYGTAIPATVITSTINTTVLVGAVSVTPTISWKLLIGDAWVVLAAGVSSALIPSFRYVRVRYDFACAVGNHLIKVNSLNVKLAVKLRNDSGAGTAAIGGTVVNFGTAFISADTPIVQPNGSTPLIPVVIYAGGTNPTGFTVKLYNISGADVGGSFSWTVRGY